VEIAHLFFDAAKVDENNPTALHPRAMKQFLYEGLKEKALLMVFPKQRPWMSMGGAGHDCAAS